MKKLLLHTCCAPCATHVIQLLKKDYEITLYFSNSNIYPKQEYEKRLENAKIIAKQTHTELIKDPYNHKQWLESVKGYEQEPEKGKRCEICFKHNLEKTAQFAKQNNYQIFATTLTISPHKDNIIINKIGKQLEEEYNKKENNTNSNKIQYLESNFKQKDGFKHSTELSKQMNLYRQGYCGCEFSFTNNIASPNE